MIVQLDILQYVSPMVDVLELDCSSCIASSYQDGGEGLVSNFHDEDDALVL